MKIMKYIYENKQIKNKINENIQNVEDNAI